jgi:hypothetical protein
MAEMFPLLEEAVREIFKENLNAASGGFRIWDF